MSDANYTYAVARIRTLEMTLLTDPFVEQLIASKDDAQALSLLGDKGWNTEGGMDEMLIREEERTWNTMRELGVPMEVFDVLMLPNRYHNLKAAIKELCTEEKNENVFFRDVSPGGDELISILREKDYTQLPEGMRDVAREAYETFLHTRDGQLCDIMVDHACLQAISRAGDKAEAEVICDYARSTVAVTDIKIAVRCAKTGKSLDFMRKALVPCETLNMDALMQAVLSGVDAVCEYLKNNGYEAAALAINESPSAFERWCDNEMIRAIRPQKTNPFSVGPLVAYVIARQNEIKTVRIILTGKVNHLTDDAIRERVREMYG